MNADATVLAARAAIEDAEAAYVAAETASNDLLAKAVAAGFNPGSGIMILESSAGVASAHQDLNRRPSRRDRAKRDTLREQVADSVDVLNAAALVLGKTRGKYHDTVRSVSDGLMFPKVVMNDD